MVRSLVVGHNDPRISYSGHWVALPAAHFTTEQNATAAFDFNGTSVSITGTVGTIDDVAVSSLSCMLDDRVNCSYAFNNERPHTLYSSPPLHERPHSVLLTLLTNSSFLSIEGMLISIDNGSHSHTSWIRSIKPRIICGIFGSILVIAILLLLLFLIRRRRKRDATLNSMGPLPLRVALPTTKEAFTARNCSTYGLSFTRYDPGPADNFTQLPPRKFRPRLKRYDDLPSSLPLNDDSTAESGQTTL